MSEKSDRLFFVLYQVGKNKIKIKVCCGKLGPNDPIPEHFSRLRNTLSINTSSNLDAFERDFVSDFRVLKSLHWIIEGLSCVVSTIGWSDELGSFFFNVEFEESDS